MRRREGRRRGRKGQERAGLEAPWRNICSRVRGIGAGRPSAAFRIDHAVDQGDEQFGEHGCRDVDAKHAFLLSAQEEGVQRFQVGLPACAFAVRVEEVRAVLEYQEYQQLAVGEVFLDQALQRLQRLGMLQVAGLDDLVQYGLSVVLEHLHQVVPRAAEAVQGGLAYAGRLGQFLQRRSRAVDDSDCQRLDESLVMGNQGHRWVPVGFSDCAHCAENWPRVQRN